MTDRQQEPRCELCDRGKARVFSREDGWEHRLRTNSVGWFVYVPCPRSKPREATDGE